MAIKSKVINNKSIIEIDDKFEKLYHTYNYDNFDYIVGNREICNGNLLQIMGSILTKGLIKNPILVKVMENGKLGIVDGQHRFLAIKKLAMGEFEGFNDEVNGLDKLVLPIYYIILEDAPLNIIPNINISKNWNDSDFINSYAAQGNENYIKIKKLKEMFPEIKYTRLYLQIVKSRPGYYNKNRIFESDIRNGTFKFENYEEAIYICEKIMDYKVCKRKYQNSPWGTYLFFASILKLIKMPVYDHDSIIKKLESNSQYLVKQHTLKDYIITISNIYNYNKRQNDKIYFENYI